MTQPIQTSLFLQATLSLTAASVMTGCSTLQTGGIAVGAGLAVLGTGAWMAQRYMARLRGPTPSATPHAVAVFQESPALQEDPAPQIAPKISPQAAINPGAIVRKRLVTLYPVFADPSYDLLTTVLIDSILESSGQTEILPDGLIAEKVQCLVDLLETRRGIGKPVEGVLLQILRPGLPPRVRSGADVVEIAKALSDPSTPAVAAEKALDTLFQAALAFPKDPLGRQSVAVVSGIGLDHRANEVVQKAAGLLEELARHGAITTDDVERLREMGLKTNRGFFVARASLMALKATALLSGEAESIKRAIDALSIDGLYHVDTNVAILAAGVLTEIANKDHAKISMLPLVGLRTKGLAREVPQDLMLAFMETLAQIASPSVAVPSEDLSVSKKAVQILFLDALPHPNPEVADLAHRHLRAVYTRRPDLFSGEMREKLATSR